jgi:hypothetical protein
MSDEKVKAVEFISEEEVQRRMFANTTESICTSALAVASEALTRAREKWGVGGERVDGFVSGDTTPAKFVTVNRISRRDVPATLYIHEPPKPKKSAEERIEDALMVLDKTIADLSESTHNYAAYENAKRARRILRGDGGE